MTTYPRPWSWPGAIALVLATCLGLGWLVGVLGATLEAVGGSDELDPAGVQLLNGIGQVLAGGLSTYLGFTVAAQHLRGFSGSQSPTEPPGGTD